MFLYCYNFFCFFCGCHYKFLIKRLNRMDIDHLCINSFCSQLFCRFQRRCNTKSVCDDRKIFSLTKNNTFSKLKFIIRVIVDNRNCKTSETHINRANMLVSSLYHSSRLNIIRRACNYHARNHTHNCKVFAALMCCSVLANRNSAVCCADFYI